jgi:hypothetical protein
MTWPFSASGKFPQKQTLYQCGSSSRLFFILSLWCSVDQAAIKPTLYGSRYHPVPLAMFLVVIQEGKSFDSYFASQRVPSLLPLWSPCPSLNIHIADSVYRSVLPPPSQPLPGTISHNSLLPTHHLSSPPIPISSLQTKGPISHPQLCYPLHYAHCQELHPVLRINPPVPSKTTRQKELAQTTHLHPTHYQRLVATLPLCAHPKIQVHLRLEPTLLRPTVYLRSP